MKKQSSEGSQMFWHQPIHFSPIKKPSIFKEFIKNFIFFQETSQKHRFHPVARRILLKIM